MAQKINKFGLPRDIPEAVRAEVRRRCAFACVVCRKVPVHYDHFEPEWVDAQNHTPAGIALLCGYHHDLRTKGVLSAANVKRKVASFLSRAAGPARYEFGVEGVQPAWKLKLGHLSLRDQGRVSVNGQAVFAVSTASDGNVVVSAVFRDPRGALIAAIEENAFVTGSNSVADFRTKGNRLFWSLRDGSQSLEARVDGDSETVEIVHMEVYVQGARLLVSEGRFQLGLHFRDGWKDILGGNGPFEGMLLDSAGDIRLHLFSSGSGDGAFMFTTPDGINVTKAP
jgi:hypothetical protein